MAAPFGKCDPSTCRVDLVQQAAMDSTRFPSAFGWLNEKQEAIAENHAGNRGLTGSEMRDLACEWVQNNGSDIRCIKETDHPERRHFHYNITVMGIDDFPRGIYFKLELGVRGSGPPSVQILSAHPPSF